MPGFHAGEQNDEDFAFHLSGNVNDLGFFIFVLSALFMYFRKTG